MHGVSHVYLILAPQATGGYHVYAPALPGLHSQGDSFHEAIVNANEAFALYIEGIDEAGRDSTQQ